MRILYLHQHFSPPQGIGNNRSFELAENWVKAGHRVTILCGSGNFNEKLPVFFLYKVLKINNIEIIRLNVSYSHFSSFAKRVISFFCYLVLAISISFRLYRTDVVYASSTPLTVGLLGIWFKKVFGKRFIFETVDLWPDVPVGMGILRNKYIVKLSFSLEKWIYQQSEMIVCLSEGMQERILAKGIQAQKVIVSHNGTNCSIFQPAQNKAIAKQALGYSETNFIVLYAGTIGLANGLEFLVEVASRTQHPTIQFIVVGNGNRKKQVMAYAKLKQVTNIVFKDSVPKEFVKTYFDAADIGAVIFAPYSILETNSANKFFDYLGSGLPVILNYEGWQNNYLNKYDCGFGSRNLEELADYITHLAENKIVCDSLGDNARRLALAQFDRKKLADTLLALFLK